MIDAIKYTPAEYSKQSRDYQVFGFVYTSLFNTLKMYTDEIKNIWTDNIDDDLLGLRANTINFELLHDWDNKDLEGITNCFKFLERSKGTKGAIETCIYILGRLRGIKIPQNPVDIEGGVITIKLPDVLDDFGILEDLLRIILPAGVLYNVSKYKEVDSTARTNVDLFDKLSYSEFIKNKYLGIYNSGDTSELNYVISEGRVQFTSEGKFVENTGQVGDNIITNTIIQSGEDSEGRWI